MKILLVHNFENIVKLENLLSAWQEFILGKKQKKDVQIFSRNLLDNILALHEDLENREYQHGGYEDFYVNDPKRRHIHKASVRDRLLHHAIYRILYPFFDKTFIPDSFSCRKDKGIHKALDRFRAVFYTVSHNNRRVCWVLKCDIKKFFDSIDHKILLNILEKYIPDKDIVDLLDNVIMSFRASPDSHRDDEESLSLHFTQDDICGIGLPLGNLTSQLFANVYMNVFDQFVKHKLKCKYYIRYADDFVFFSTDKKYLENLIPEVRNFLIEKLKLTLHPTKIYLQTVSQGIDFLGWKHFVDHRILRKTTQKRMLRRVEDTPTNDVLQSYLGMLGHGNSCKIREELLNNFWLRRNYYVIGQVK